MSLNFFVRFSVSKKPSFCIFSNIFLWMQGDFSWIQPLDLLCILRLHYWVRLVKNFLKYWWCWAVLDWLCLLSDKLLGHLLCILRFHRCLYLAHMLILMCFQPTQELSSAFSCYSDWGRYLTILSNFSLCAALCECNEFSPTSGSRLWGYCSYKHLLHSVHLGKYFFLWTFGL